MMVENNESVRYAGFWVRCVAMLVDTFVLAVPIGVVIYLLSDGAWFDFGAYMDHLRYAMQGDAVRALEAMPKTQLTWEITFELSVMVIVILFWRRWKGATPGKRYVDIRIVDARSFDEIDNQQAILRTLGYIASTLLFLVGFLMIAFRTDKRGLHDLMAGTAVIYNTMKKDTSPVSVKGE